MPGTLIAMRTLVAIATVLVVAACGTSNPLTGAVTPADVAVQQNDLPKSLVRCDGSGDMDTFLNSVKTKDPSTYQSTKSEWDAAKSHGATAAEVVFYSDKKADCASIQNSGNGDLASATYPLVVNFVIQFKDEQTAAKGYTTESIFGFSESTLASSGGTGVVKGKDTGLTANSIALTVAIGNQSFYVAVWQNKAFMVILGVLNIDLAASKKIATNEDSRIK
jgi:predicted small lipoprotein YifL